MTIVFNIGGIMEYPSVSILYWAFVALGGLLVLTKALRYGSRPKNYPPGRNILQQVLGYRIELTVWVQGLLHCPYLEICTRCQLRISIWNSKNWPKNVGKH